jgi:hypothetical protein
MEKYKVIKSYIETEYAYVEANSEDEAIKKAIEEDIWEKNPNDDIYLNFEYIAIRDND